MTVIVGREGGRLLRAGIYFLIVVTGLWSTIWPPLTFAGTSNQIFAVIYGTALVIGGTACLWGTGCGRWDGELVGLPVTIAAFAGYSVLLCVAASSSLTRGTAAGVAIIATGMLADRWRGVRIIAQLAREAAADEPGNVGTA